MTESILKRRIFWFLLAAKLITLLYILILSSGMTQAELKTAIPLIIPLFAAYLVPMWKEVVANRTVEPEDEDSEKKPSEPKLRKTFVQVLYIAFPFYLLTILLVLTLFVKGSLGGDGDRSGNLAIYIGAIETGFGVYLGPVVAAMFGGKKT